MTLKQRIDYLIENKYNSLRALAADMEIDVGYLAKLRSGMKTRPGKKVLEKLGLKEVTHYELL